MTCLTELRQLFETETRSGGGSPVCKTAPAKGHYYGQGEWQLVKRLAGEIPCTTSSSTLPACESSHNS
jgi:hypothetical protein